MTELPEHVLRNRVVWDRWASEYVAPAEIQWASEMPTWGIWAVLGWQTAVLDHRVQCAA